MVVRTACWTILPLLRWASRRGAGTRPERLARLTVSMLRGEEGRQRKELEKLLRWLETEVRPDVVHLSTVLLAGVARQIPPPAGRAGGRHALRRRRFLEKLPQPHYEAARRELAPHGPPTWTPWWR